MPQCRVLLTDTGAFRIGPQECKLEPIHRANGRFTYPRKSPYIADDKRIIFPPRECQPTTYRTVFGPAFYHNSIEYGNSAVNISLASTRLTNVRKPEQVGLHETLCENQRVFYYAHFTHFITYFCERFSILFLPLDNFYEAFTFAHSTHPKMLMRVAAFTLIVFTGMYYFPTIIKRATAKIKTFEWAKPGKLPRQIVDLSAIGSLIAGWVIAYIKDVFAYQPYLYCGGICEFVKAPSVSVLRSVFQTAISPTHWLHFWLHSDDAFISLSLNGNTYFVEMDISSCDTSHTEVLFECVLAILPDSFIKELISAVVQQCIVPLTTTNPQAKWEKVTITPNTYVLYSGSTLTTLINNLANYLIFTSIALCHDQLETAGRDDICAIITRAARRAGYIVTVDIFENIQECTFLKHASTAGGEPWLVAGVFQRISGVCRGDLPGTGPLEERALIRQRDLVACMQHAGDTSVNKLLRAIYPCGKVVSTGSYMLDALNTTPPPWFTPSREISDFDFCTRYNASPGQLDEHLEVISQMSYGNVVNTQLSRLIFAKDYSIKFSEAGL